jgi:hypothetical protein
MGRGARVYVGVSLPRYDVAESMTCPPIRVGSQGLAPVRTQVHALALGLTSEC